ncbi:MAG: MarR family transcriptional regulator [Candidatus Freyarchaeota archaeon]
MSSFVGTRALCAATAAYFSSKGYFVRRDFEIMDTRVDIIGIMPRLSDLKMRIKSKYFVPSGILYSLLGRKWKSTKEIADETGSDKMFVSSALEEALEDGWVERREKEGDRILWRAKNYRIPSKDCVVAHCRYTECTEFLERIDELEGCCNRIYVVFPYPIDEEFMDLCSEKGVGILIYYERVGLFKELLPPELKTITELRVYANLCEVIIKENLLYRSMDSI